MPCVFLVYICSLRLLSPNFGDKVYILLHFLHSAKNIRKVEKGKVVGEKIERVRENGKSASI